MDVLSLKSFSWETERLCLRPLAEGDEALFHALYTDAQIMRFIGTPLTAAEAASQFRKIVHRQGEPALDRRFLVIVAKNTRAPLGICGTSHYDPGTMRLEVGMVLLPEGRGRGVAREALVALVGRVLEERLVGGVCVRFAAGNTAMRSLASSIGFSSDGAARGRRQDSTICHWSVHRSSWRSSETTNSQGKAHVQCDRCS